jgi:hypothetical protein
MSISLRAPARWWLNEPFGPASPAKRGTGANLDFQVGGNELDFVGGFG